MKAASKQHRRRDAKGYGKLAHCRLSFQASAIRKLRPDAPHGNAILASEMRSRVGSLANGETRSRW
jgi:hypothetical protein